MSEVESVTEEQNQKNLAKSIFRLTWMPRYLLTPIALETVFLEDSEDRDNTVGYKMFYLFGWRLCTWRIDE